MTNTSPAIIQPATNPIPPIGGSAHMPDLPFPPAPTMSLMSPPSAPCTIAMRSIVFQEIWLTNLPSNWFGIAANSSNIVAYSNNFPCGNLGNWIYPPQPNNYWHGWFSNTPAAYFFIYTITNTVSAWNGTNQIVTLTSNGVYDIDIWLGFWQVMSPPYVTNVTDTTNWLAPDSNTYQLIYDNYQTTNEN